MPPSPADQPPHRLRRTSPSVSIVIPVRDAAGLPPMLRTLPAADEVIVVTAAPVPAAAVAAACPGALLVRQTRSGLGNALACGVAASTGDVVVTLDGDGATDPGEMRRYVDALAAGADMAVGSRYREGGRDLTTGRFRRGLNLALVWLLNALYGVRRTDPGFGYAAFRRDSLDQLALPDPSATLPVWGDGPEIEALLAVRAAARGLTVTEVPGVAYPRMRRSSHHDRATLGHWLRALATEFRGRTAHPPRHSAPAGVSGPSGVGSNPAGPSRAPSRAVVPPPRPADQPAQPQPERRALPDRRVPPSDRRSATAANAGNDPVEPIWGPPRRSPEPADLWLADIPAPLDRPARPLPADPGEASPRPATPDRPVIASVPVPRTGDAGRVAGRRQEERRQDESRPDEPEVAEPPREVGARRRHLEGYRQRPDLRVINGEGAGSGRSRSGRLRAVPPRETTGGRPGPQ
jgi:hypothetical protein